MGSQGDQPEQSTSSQEATGSGFANNRSDPDRAVQNLIGAHYEAVYRFAYRLSGTSADAEDLTQHAFLTACRKIDQLREESKGRSWLFTIVRNAFLKKVKKQPATMVPFEDELSVDEGDSQHNLQFDEEKLQAVLNEMPEVYRSPVLLFYFEELSYKEISTMLDVPIGTVMSRLARGKRYLRDQLTTDE